MLPSALTEELQMLHRVYASQIVGKHDVLLNVFPKHQAEIEAYPYPVEVEAVLDPELFARRLCGCRAVIASRLHGAVIALHSGVPTIAAWPTPNGNKIPDLMSNVLRIPDQFLLVHNGLTRHELMHRVGLVRKAYANGRRRGMFDRLGLISRHTHGASLRMFKTLFRLQLPGERTSVASGSGGFWRCQEHTPLVEDTAVRVEARAAAAEGAESEARHPIEGRGKTPTGHDVGVSTPPWKQWGQAWGLGRTTTAHVVGGEVSFAGNLALSLAILVVIALLGLPGLTFLRKSEPDSPPDLAAPGADVPSAEKPQELAEGGHTAANPRCWSSFGQRPLRVADVVFFGVNYALWVVLAMGFNVCSKTYMRETRNPVALLAIQGWVGVAVLCAMNLVTRFRQDHRSSNSVASSPSSSSSSSPSSSSSSAPPWLGKCGPKQARRAAPSVWQAGLLHSANAVLTSWSVLAGGVAATHALKALEPVAAAGFSRWLLGSTLPPGRAAAVAIIVLGLGILMVPLHVPWWIRWRGDVEDQSDSSDTGGVELVVPAILTACACCAVALRNVLLKGRDTPPPPPPLGLLVCSVVAAGVGTMGLLVPLLPWSWEWAAEPLLRVSGCNAALCFVGYNLASFNLLSELSPVGHAVGNASKRVCLFATGLFLLSEDASMSPRQLAGASVAFLGLASYNLAGTNTPYSSPSSR